MSSLRDLARIDLARIDRSSFKVSSVGDRVLIHPLPSKRRWVEAELHLRSAVCDAEGRVKSLGFPKFFNFGEHAPHDARFVDALGRGAVEFPEKLDGSLIVADIDGDGALSLRTRQSLGLNELEPLMKALIAERYPRLRDALASDLAVREGCSVLFEFVHPDRPVVLRYERAALYLLALMDKRTLAPRWDEPVLARIAEQSGVERAAHHALPQEVTGLRAALSSWSDREGVVARAVDRDGAPLLIKIKTDSYLRLHANRARLGAGSAARVAFLLGSEDEEAFSRALEARGFDYEAITFARQNLGDYFERRRRTDRALAELSGEFAGSGRVGRGDKRAFVERARAFIAERSERFVEPIWFDVAVKLFEGRADDARVVSYSALLGEPGPTVRQWMKSAERELSAMLEREVREEE